MGFKRRISSLFKCKQEEENTSFESKHEEEYFLHNGGELLAKLIAVTNGRYGVPIHSFTAKELARATNNFSHSILDGVMFRGHLERRQVMVTRDRQLSRYIAPEEAINDIVFGSQMSHLKNVLKLIGCCLEFKIPISVYEYVEGFLLSDLLFNRDNNIILSWRNRIKIASDIARTIAYLHTSFETLVIYRDLNPSKVIIDQYGVAKLFNFGLCITLPPGELGVKTKVAGTYGFVDPAYISTGYITQKADVFGFGVFCLTLLTGRKVHPGKKFMLDDVKYCADNHQYDEFIDARILEEVGEVGENLVHSFLNLALMCIQDDGEDRPDMIDVAKQLRVLEKSFPNPLPTINS